MIARLHGVLHEKTPEQLIVDVGGVGYQVLVSLQTFYHLVLIFMVLTVFSIELLVVLFRQKVLSI